MTELLKSDGLLQIDGSFGEGGGQILRSSLALALVTGQGIQITNIRAKRKRPGLARQHLMAVSAAAEVGCAQVTGAAIGATSLEFIPDTQHGIEGGKFQFNIDSAGSTILVLQTLLPALLLARGPSTLTLSGGTHNPQAPTWDHFAKTFVPRLVPMGLTVQTDLIRYGFYPAGGGELTAEITPQKSWRPQGLLERGKRTRVAATILTAHLPEHIAQREQKTLVQRAGLPEDAIEIIPVHNSLGPGNVVAITAESDTITETFTAFGQKGVAAERVAAQVAREFRQYENANVPVGPYTADQILLPMAIAAWQGNGKSEFRTLPLTEHSRTHIELIRKFLHIDITVKEESALASKTGEAIKTVLVQVG